MKFFTKSNIIEFLCINLGCLMVAFGIVVFRNPNGFATGGMSGISLFISVMFGGLTVGSIMMALNVTALVLGFFFLGKEKIKRSIYCTFVLSGFMWILELLIPLYGPLTNQPFLELIYSVFIPGFGAAIIFHFGATTGGMDIIAQIVGKFLKMKVTTSLLVIDFVIALTAGLVFGVEAMLYSVVGVVLRIYAMDAVMDGLKTRKVIVVISEKSADIQKFITYELKRGATVHKAMGVYTNLEKEVITTILSRRQAIILQSFIKETDPHAFITISNSAEIIGTGFGKFD